jgi:hypothetical protein
MAFDRQNLTIMAGNVKSGEVPAIWYYWNEDNDTVTTAGFFTDKRVKVGDQIAVIGNTMVAIVWYHCTAVSATGEATVVAN